MTQETRRPQDKIYYAAERRRATWKKFGAALDPENDDITQLGEEVFLVLRYPNKCYKKEDVIKNVNKMIDDSYKLVVIEDRKRTRVIKHEEDTEPTTPQDGKYRPPTKRGTPNDIQDKLEEQKRLSIVVVTDLNNVMPDDIHALFGRFGTITRLHNIFHDNSEYVRIAFIHYEEPQYANAAIIEMNKRPLNSVIIRVEHAKPKKNS
jgi:RNA recognition motif-containing protein